MRHCLVISIMATVFPYAAAGVENAALAGTGPLGIRGWRNDWTGCYPDATPVTAWDIEKGINILWRVPTARYGNAMPLIIGDRLYFTIEWGHLVCMEKLTGRVLWTSLDADATASAALFTVDPKAVPWSKRTLSYGANAGTAFPTPVTDGKRIWCKAGATAFCYDAGDGRRLWSTALRVTEGDHPHTVASPLLVGKVLVCQGGSTEYWEKNSTNRIPAGVLPKNPQTGKFAQWMVGLDADTGTILWDLGPLNAGGYGAALTPVPVIVDDGNGPQVFVVTTEGQVIRPDNGKLVMPYAGARTGCTSPTPLGNRVLFANALIEFSLRQPDELAVRTVCGVTAPGNIGGPVYSNGMVYSGYRSAGVANRLYGVCEAATGRKVHMGVRGPEGISETPEWLPPAVAGRYLFFPTLESIDVADISLGRPFPLAMNRNERSHASPVFDGERMYLRTYDAIICIARTGETGARYEREVNARTVIKAFPKKIGDGTFVAITPVDNVAEWIDGPAFMYAPGKGPDQWIWAGPFPAGAGNDALDALGGCAKARPAAGQAVTCEGGDRVFAAVAARFIRPMALDTDGPTGKDRKGRSFFFTWLVVGKTEYTTWDPCRPGVRLWLGGMEVKPAQVLKLAKGAYPCLMQVALTEEAGAVKDMVVQTAFSQTEAPDEIRKRDLEMVREGRDYLRMVSTVLAGTEEAKQADLLLKTAE